MDGKWRIPIEWDEYMNSRKWVRKIPYVQFPRTWEVAVIPPFAGACVRFLVRRKGDGGVGISVYLDTQHNLGLWSHDEEGEPIPYWEMYPNKEGDVSRFDLDDIPGLLKALKRAM